MTTTRKRAAAANGTKPRGKGGRPREVDGDAVEFTIRLGAHQLEWLERRYPVRTRAGKVRDLVDDARSGAARRASHWPARIVVGVWVDPRGGGGAVVALSLAGSRPRLIVQGGFAGDATPDVVREAVRNVVALADGERERPGAAVDLAAIGYLIAPTDIGRHDARRTGIAWGVAYAALASCALPVVEVDAATMRARLAVEGWDASGQGALEDYARVVALAGLDAAVAARVAAPA